MGDNVLVQAPVYNMFYHSIENNGRHVLSSDLLYEDGKYRIDFDDLEAKLAEPLTTLMILCNPHNPVGKVWRRSELTKIAQLCEMYNVTLLSDEIHGDLVLDGPDYTPAFSLAEPLNQRVISLVSPSKTFNVAALHAATAIIPNADLREQVTRGFNQDEVAEPNLLAIPGSIAAYRHGQDWRTALREQLRRNYGQALSFINDQVPGATVVESTATYLMWIDVSALTHDADSLTEFIQLKTGLILSSGSVYRGNGSSFLRMNFACPSDMLQDGLNRLRDGIQAYQATL